MSAPLAPAVHLAPPVGWMNDPNGLHHVDGCWHAYYQHNPHDDIWGPMHWRHARSFDLARWSDEGIVLEPGPLGDAFSGSVVVDHENTAGFGPGARIAIFTLATPDQQRQGLAFSHDGHEWETFAGNPVLADPSVSDFRDPKVLWTHGSWLMCLAAGPVVRFYRSDDLRSWELVGDHAPRVSGTVECPDLLRFGADGDERWALVYSELSGDPSTPGCSVEVGSFDGSTFLAGGPPSALDHGPDFYAAQSFSGVAPDAPVMQAWMSNWNYALTHPSAGRRGVLTLPRRLTLNGSTVEVTPAVDLTDVFDAPAASATWSSEPHQACRVRGDRFDLVVTGDDGAACRVTSDEVVTIHRPAFIDSVGEVEVVLAHDGGPIDVVVDHGTLEVFAGGRSCSLLTFAGPRWDVVTDGSAQLIVSR